MAETKSDEPEVLSLEELKEAWSWLVPHERLAGFRLLDRADAEELFLSLSAHDQGDLILALPVRDRMSWMRILAPDDAADLLQAAASEERAQLLDLLDAPTRKEVTALLAYAEDDAGGLMSPRFARVRPDMTVDEAISYLRKQAREHVETIYYAYVLDAEQHLLGVVSFRELFSASADRLVRDVMRTEVVTVNEGMDQEAVSRIVFEHGLVAIPVVDAEHRMKGIVTVDDIVDVVEEEATEDIQKIGGMEALDAPYLQIGLGSMIKKRAVWLAALFLSEMLTTTAMTHFADEIAHAVVLALFLPLIISSGGNSGSQASTLVIRAMALGEVKLTDVLRVIRREIASGFALGVILGCIGVLRILLWQTIGWYNYGPHVMVIALTIGVSLIGVVMFGSIAGSMLPFVLRRLGLDPASASAPFVATLVDVTGLIIYFSVASLILRGTLL